MVLCQSGALPAGYPLEQTLEEEADLSEFGVMVDALGGGDMGREGTCVFVFGELSGEATVFDFTLSDAYLKIVFGGVAEVYVTDILEDLFVVAAGVWSADVVAGVEADAESRDVVAEDDDGVGVLRHLADFGVDGDDEAIGGSDLDQLAKAFDFAVERCAEFGAGDAEGDDSGGFGELAAGGEAFVVGGFLFVARVDVVGDGGEAMVSRAGTDGRFEVFLNLRGRKLLAGLANSDFDVGEFEIRQLGEGIG